MWESDHRNSSLCCAYRVISVLSLSLSVVHSLLNQCQRCCYRSSGSAIETCFLRNPRAPVSAGHWTVEMNGLLVDNDNTIGDMSRKSGSQTQFLLTNYIPFSVYLLILVSCGVGVHTPVRFSQSAMVIHSYYFIDSLCCCIGLYYVDCGHENPALVVLFFLLRH